MMINRNNFVLDEIPKLSPLSSEYSIFWKDQKQKILHGEWSGGYWCPGTLYHFANFWYIEIKEKPTDKFGVVSLPFLRDIDYEIHIAYNEARGFSRFEKQDPKEVEGLHPRDIMSRQYPFDMGKPLFENQAKNIILVTNRGCGKSYNVASIIGYEYEFTPDERGRKEVLVGAWDTKYSDDLLTKVKLGLDSYPGAIEVNGKYYPAPFHKRYTGSFDSGKFIENRYYVFKGRNKVTKGDKSKIHHRVYKNNNQAGVGTRPVLAVYEESGEFPNLESSWNANLQAIRYGMNQFGTNFAIGTGGNMKSGSLDISKMMWSPDAYNCVKFEDKITHKGYHSLFIPAQKGLNEYKDENGNSVEEVALKDILDYRTKLVNDGASRETIEQEIMYRPTKLDEAFLISSGNIFPKAWLQEHLGNLESREEYKHLGQVGRLEFLEKEKLSWIIDPKLRQITDFPLKEGTNTDGAIVIYEHPYLDPDGKVPNWLYIAGLDPVDHDQADYSSSLLSFHIYKRFIKTDSTFDWPVAEYTGRPEFVEEAYENCRKLLIYYNARCMYENNLKGFFIYMRQMRSEYLLADSPTIIKDIIEDSKVNRIKGVHMVEKIKDHCERKTNSYLRTEYAPGKKNLEKIPSPALVKELIMYDPKKGNFDRVMSFFMVMLFDEEIHHYTVTENKRQNKINEFFPSPGKLFANKPNLLS